MMFTILARYFTITRDSLYFCCDLMSKKFLQLIAEGSSGIKSLTIHQSCVCPVLPCVEALRCYSPCPQFIVVDCNWVMDMKILNVVRGSGFVECFSYQRMQFLSHFVRFAPGCSQQRKCYFDQRCLSVLFNNQKEHRICG